MRFHCGNPTVLLLLAFCLSAHGQTDLDDAVWLERSRRLLEEATAQMPPPWLRVEPDDVAKSAAEQIATEALEHVIPSAPADHASEQILIFASFSLPRPTLVQLLEEASQPNVVLVLRGMPEKSTVPETIRRLRALLPQESRIPQVMLDPTLFRRFNVRRVPTLVLQRSPGKKPIQVQGAVTTAWLRRMASVAREGDEHLGRRAEDYEIAEPDLMLQMQRRLATIDWSARRKAAGSTFWQRQQPGFVSLPQASESRQFAVDPSVRVTADLRDAEGQRLVAAGETFNPLQFVPLTKTVIVFQGTSKPQVQIARQLAQSVRRRGRGMILLTSDIETSRGWDHLGELEQAFEQAVYVLPQSLVQRFQIQRIPAMVESRGDALVITEVPVSEAP